MARVNMEGRLYSSPEIKQLAHMMGWKLGTAYGTLYMLWHDSQILGKTECTATDLLSWCDTISKRNLVKFVDAMVECGFFIKRANEIFIISGNERHIRNLEQCIVTGKQLKKVS